MRFYHVNGLAACRPCFEKNVTTTHQNVTVANSTQYILRELRQIISVQFIPLTSGDPDLIF